MKVGQIVEAAWWKGKLQEALTSTREPPQMSPVRERRELDDGPLRPGSLRAAHRLSGCKPGLWCLKISFEVRARADLARKSRRTARENKVQRAVYANAPLIRGCLASVPPRQRVASC
jgi:hypothetical protein